MFRKYNSIENSYQKEFVDRIKREGYDQQTFVVQEKAHGANFSFWTENGINFSYGKRTGELKWEEKFYNFQFVFEKVKIQLQMLWKEVNQEFENVEILHIFGELIGGNYNHADVAKDKQAVLTQKGIYYSPSNEFYAFDMMINYKNYLDVDIANSLFKKAGMLYAENLFEGNINECLSYPNEFESTIARQLQLPPILPNIAEGIVIKPNKTCFFDGGQRVILKNKNEKWAEVAKRKKRVKPPQEISDKVKYLQEEILHYVTENRFNNLLSKLGSFSHKDIGKVLGMFSKDIVEDFEKDFEKEMNELDKNEQKLVKKSISNSAKNIILHAIKNQ